MKKQFLVCAFALGAFVFTANTSSAQVSDVSEEATVVEASQVPPTITSSFDSKYEGVQNADWSMENEVYKAKFDKEGKEMHAEFSPEGEWLETATIVKEEDLPASASEFITQNYAEFEIEKSKKIETAEETTYMVKVKNDTEEASLYFDENGNNIDDGMGEENIEKEVEEGMDEIEGEVEEVEGEIEGETKEVKGEIEGQ